MNHAITPGAPAGERSWLAALCLSRFFFNLIYMAYAAALPTLTREWGMTATEAGFVQTCFFVGFAISLFFTSWFSDHIGAKRIFLTFCWLAAVTALLFAIYARSYSQALWLFALVGFSQGGTYIPAIMLVSQKLPSERRGWGVGWVLASMSAGYVGSISLATGFTATHGYQVALLVCAVGSVLGALFGTSAARRSANVVSDAVEGSRAWSVLFRDRRSLLLTVGYIGHSWELFGVWAWAPAFLIVSLGGRFALGAVGLGIAIAIVLHLSGFVSSFTMGRASDRFGRRIILIVMAAIGTACSFGFGWSGALPATVLLLFAALYGFTAIGDSAVLSTAMTESVPPEVLGRALAVRSILGIGVGALAPFAFGGVLDMFEPGQGWGWAFIALGLGGAIATFCAVLLAKDS